MENFLALMIGQLIGVSLGVLMNAIFLMLAIKLVLQFRIAYLNSLKITIISFVLIIIIVSLLSYLFELLMLVFIAFFIQVSIYSSYIKNPEGIKIGGANAALVSVTQILIGIGFTLSLSLILSLFL